MQKISTRQVYIMFILTTLSPAIALFPSFVARHGSAAGWIAPIAASVGLIAVIAVLHGLFKSGRFADLHGVFGGTFGKWSAKPLLTVYLLWTFALFLLYVRYYAERIVASMFTSVNPDFFIISMLIVVFFASRAKLSAIARFSEVAILVFAVIFAVFFVSLIPTLRAIHVLPVTHYDAVPVLRSAYPIVSVWGFITLFFFLGEHIEKPDLKSFAKKAVLILSVATALMIFLVVGSLGPDTAARMPWPFFSAAKLIDIMQSFDRLEAVLSSIWVIADFILITVFVFIITNIVKKLFNLRESRYLTGPVAMLGYAGSLLLAANTRELELFAASSTTHAVNLVLCVGVPVLALAIGKMRRAL
ncbi:MAG: spore germination protein [Oscillospiraceae bacterium]|nr:spore germination protein [Oscillospiraceae bacterium]